MRKTLWLTLVAALGLSACANLDDKPAHELAKISRDRIFTDDYRFSFSGEVRAYVSKPEEGVAPEEAKQHSAKPDDVDKLLDKMAQDKADSLPTDEERQATFLNELEKSLNMNLGGRAADFLKDYPSAKRYLANGRLKFTGAVDLPAKKIEIVPELSFHNRNEQSSIKMPMLLDGESMSLTAEVPATVPLVLDFVTDAPMRQRLLDEPLRVRAEDIDAFKGVPLKHAGKAFIEAMVKANDALPPEAFKLKEMDAFGKKAGARYRVQLTGRDAYQSVVGEAFEKEFSQKINELEKNPEPGSNAEGYQKLRDLGSKYKRINSESLGMERMFGSPLYTDYYLNRKGRILAVRSYMQMNGESDALNIVADGIYRYGKPTFTLNPSVKAVTLTELTDSIQAHSKAKKEQREREWAQAEAAAEMETQAVELRQPKAKKAKAKQKKRR